jgi:hypothetical protein
MRFETLAAQFSLEIATRADPGPIAAVRVRIDVGRIVSMVRSCLNNGRT